MKAWGFFGASFGLRRWAQRLLPTLPLRRYILETKSLLAPGTISSAGDQRIPCGRHMALDLTDAFTVTDNRHQASPESPPKFECTTCTTGTKGSHASSLAYTSPKDLPEVDTQNEIVLSSNKKGIVHQCRPFVDVKACRGITREGTMRAYLRESAGAPFRPFQLLSNI